MAGKQTHPHTGLKVYLIRHAESNNNLASCTMERSEYERIREHDPTLSEGGIEEARQLGQYMKNHPDKFDNFIDQCFAEIHCSAMTRSLQTADIISKEIGLDPIVWVDIHEVKGCRSRGQAYLGKSRGQILERFPNFVLPPEITDEGWYFLGREETEEEAWERAGRVWERLTHLSELDEYQGKAILIVTHGLFLDFLMGRLCNREMKGPPRFAFYNTGYSLVWLKKPRTIVHYIDRIEHLTVIPLLYRNGELDD
ncbi:unnamed protein product [Blepharisma stoltei]|uniref:Phosphoglycerate mutase n=1 Tax=Blepharisma stoltei TaxID=1481888 RepID=A0AAU9KCU8_9CILI|nr:unnamed protein product [Blepharisma stoltei]